MNRIMSGGSRCESYQTKAWDSNPYRANTWDQVKTICDSYTRLIAWTTESSFFSGLIPISSVILIISEVSLISGCRGVRTNDEMDNSLSKSKLCVCVCRTMKCKVGTREESLKSQTHFWDSSLNSNIKI